MILSWCTVCKLIGWWFLITTLIFVMWMWSCGLSFDRPEGQVFDYIRSIIRADSTGKTPTVMSYCEN